jgi:hypothetical protein
MGAATGGSVLEARIPLSPSKPLRQTSPEAAASARSASRARPRALSRDHGPVSLRETRRGRPPSPHAKLHRLPHHGAAWRALAAAWQARRMRPYCCQRPRLRSAHHSLRASPMRRVRRAQTAHLTLHAGLGAQDPLPPLANQQDRLALPRAPRAPQATARAAAAAASTLVRVALLRPHRCPLARDRPQTRSTHVRDQPRHLRPPPTPFQLRPHSPLFGPPLLAMHLLPAPSAPMLPPG